jgi:hypothetical protein
VALTAGAAAGAAGAGDAFAPPGTGGAVRAARRSKLRRKAEPTSGPGHQDPVAAVAAAATASPRGAEGSPRGNGQGLADEDERLPDKAPEWLQVRHASPAAWPR